MKFFVFYRDIIPFTYYYFLVKLKNEDLYGFIIGNKSKHWEWTNDLTTDERDWQEDENFTIVSVNEVPKKEKLFFTIFKQIVEYEE